MCIFRRRIKEKNFFNFNKKKLDLKGIKASLPNNKLPVDFSLGEFTSENFPTDVNDSLKQLDLLQVQIAKVINTMHEGEAKEKKKAEYFDVLLKMFALAQKPSSSLEIEKKKNMNNFSDLYDYYSSSDFEIANINKHDLDNPGLIIWPVALQDRPTIIHKAQIEIIKTLQNKNWILKIIIADCGTSDAIRKISHFRSELERHLNKRNVRFEGISLLSDYYRPDAAGGMILKKFVDISTNLKISDLKEYNTKQDSYSNENKQKIENRYTLKFIEPVLTWSVVINEADQYCDNNRGKKTIVVAGRDELNQWKYIFGFSSNIGGIFNLILKDEGEKTIFQEEKPMIFHSENEVIENLDRGNLARWLFESFIVTPSYPVDLKDLQFCTQCKKASACRECLFVNSPDAKLPSFVDKRKFVKSFWEIINPS